MGTTTAWLERSLQNCSLNHSSSSSSSSRSSDFSDVVVNEPYLHHRRNHSLPATVSAASSSSSAASSSDDNSTLIDLHSHVSLPYHWEQCLDLKTGELYYVNWSTGLKAKQDPRTLSTGYSGDYDSEEDDKDDDEEEGISSTYESELSTTESSSCTESLRSTKSHQRQRQQVKEESVLVVAGCKSCLMYYMLPKYAHQCPKCCGQLLHFPANNTPSP